MVKKVRKLNVGLARKTQELWSRMQDDARETARIAKRPVKKDAGGNIDMGDAVRNAGSVVWNSYITALDFDSAVLLWLARKMVQLGADNKVINWLEKKYANQKMKKGKDGKDKKLKKITKDSPRLSSYLTYYFMLMLLTSGVYVGRNRQDIGEKIKDKIENVKGSFRRDKKKIPETISEIKIDPTAPHEDWQKQIDAIWPYIYMETVLSEGYVNEAYADVGDNAGYMTIGSGFMLGKTKPATDKEYAIIAERKAFFKKILGKKYVNGISISLDENRKLVYNFYKSYVWPEMRKAFTEPMDVHLFIELGIGAYNRGGGIYKDSKDGSVIKDSVNAKADIVNIANLLDDLCKSGFGGLEPKYGIAAHRVLGDISDADILESYANSVFGMKSSKLWGKGKLKDYPTVADDLKSIKGINADITKNGKTYTQHMLTYYLTADEIKTIKEGGLFTDYDFNTSRQEATPVTPAEKLNDEGENLYNKGKYADAAEKFKEAIKEDSKLYIAYSNLAISYYQLQEYDKGAEVIDKFIKKSGFGSVPNDIQGYTYYNGALCYEKLGDKETNTNKKLSYYKKAQEYAQKGESVADTKYNALDTRLKTKVEEATVNKTTAFRNATNKLKSKTQKGRDANVNVVDQNSADRT